MRANSFMFPYVRAWCRKSFETTEFMSGLDMMMTNELPMFYLFVKHSGLTDGDYRRLVTLG